jgi:hypothetical protein
MAWRALLDGADRERARALVEAIADEIDRRDRVDASLAFGDAGIALLHGYRARAGCEDGADRAYAALERALAGLGELGRPWLFSGLAGVGFAVHDLAEVLGEADDVLAQLDELVARAAAIDVPFFDLTSGAVGLGVYGLARGVPAIVAAAVERVTALAERDPSGAAWRTREPEHPDGYINLGLAHGVAGAIAFLADAQAAGHVRDPALVADAVRWLRAREREATVPRLPMYEADRDVGFPRTLDAWCVGDPSTALVLVRAGQRLGEPTWRAAGRSLALEAARRTDDELAAITIDTSMCHGAISLAHLFNRLASELGDRELEAAAHRWYARVLASDLIATTPDTGLQLGLAGIALGLLAASTDVEPAWDRALLLS